MPAIPADWRLQDGWDTWFRADAVVSHPLDLECSSRRQPTCCRCLACSPRNPIATAKPSVTMTDSSWLHDRGRGDVETTSSLTVAWAIDRILDDQATSAQIMAFAGAARAR